MATQQAVLEYVTTTKIGEKGQLTVPKQYRDDLGLETGAPVAVLRMGDGLFLLPEQQRFNHLCEKISAILTNAGITPEEVLATLPETRRRIYEQRFGKASTAKPEAGRANKGQRKK